MSRRFEWESAHSGAAWYYTHHGYSWGSVAVVNDTAFSVFVRYEFREPAKWVTHVDNLDDAKALVQTLVGASHA